MSHRVRMLLAIACLGSANHLLAADASFVGRWKIDLEKSNVLGLQTRIEDLGHDEFKFNYGDDWEIFTIDGNEHPTRYGSMRTATVEGPDHWKVVTRRDGKVTVTQTWTIADGGQTLRTIWEGIRPDGSAFKSENAAKRVAGTTGLAGTWESTKMDPSAYPDIAFEADEKDGLSFVIPRDEEHDNIKFDGNDYANQGPRIAPGETTAGKRIDERTIELTNKLKDKVVGIQRFELSADGRTLTDTLSYPGVEKKQVRVYARQ